MPRARKDLEAVVAFIDDLQSKALVPALKFHFADGFPFSPPRKPRGHKTWGNFNFRIAELPMLANPDPIARSMTTTLTSKKTHWLSFSPWDWTPTDSPLGHTG